MDKTLELLAKFLDKSSDRIVSIVNFGGDVIILFAAKLSAIVLAVGGALANKTGGLVGVLHDNTGRIKDVLEGKRGGNGTDGTPTD